MQIPKFSTPIEDYHKALRKVKTLTDLKAMQEKYALILDDAVEVFENMSEENFAEFISYLPKTFKENASESEFCEDWAFKYGAIVLPELHIRICALLSQTQMPSGFVLNRLLDAELAEIKDGKFCLRIVEI